MIDIHPINDDVGGMFIDRKFITAKTFALVFGNVTCRPKAISNNVNG